MRSTARTTPAVYKQRGFQAPGSQRAIVAGAVVPEPLCFGDVHWYPVEMTACVLATADTSPVFLGSAQPRKLRIQHGDSFCRRFPRCIVLSHRAIGHGSEAGQTS